MEGENASRTDQRALHTPIYDFEEIVSRFVATFPQSSLQVWLYEGSTTRLRIVAGSDEGDLNAQAPEDSRLAQIAASGQPLFFDGQGDVASPAEANMEQVVCSLIPVSVREEIVGFLYACVAQPGLFTSHCLSYLQTAASYIGISLHTRRLVEEAWKRTAELETVYGVTEAVRTLKPLYAQELVDNMAREYLMAATMRRAVSAMGTSLDTETILERFLSAVQGLVPVDSATLTLMMGGEVVFYEHAPYGDVAPAELLKRSNDQLRHSPLLNQVIETQEPLVIKDVRAHPDWIVVEGAEHICSWIAVPLVASNELLGVLMLDSVQPDAYGQRELWLVSTLAVHASLALQNAQLYTQAQRRIEELSTFHEIVLHLNTPLELEEVLRNITEAALRLIEANNLHIYLWSEEKDEFTFCSALWRDGSRKPAVDAPRRDGLTASVVHSGEAIFIDNANSHPLYQSEEAGKWGVQAIAGFPLRHSGRIIGVFTVTYLEPHRFTPDEQLLMNLLADQAAVAVENARTFNAAQQRLRSMSALVDMAKQVTGNLKVELVLQTTVQTLQKLLNARASTIALLSDDGRELTVEAAAGIKPQYHRVRIRLGEGVSGRAVSEQRMIYIRDTYREPDFLFFDDVLRSLLVVPLITRNKVIGTLTVDSDRPEAFSDTDTQLLTIAAAQVSVAIGNARLFEALEERAAELAVAYEELKENDRLKDELVQNVSHELRTPLTFIRGYVDLLIDGELGELSQEQVRALKIVAQKTAEVTRLVEDIMSLQRIDSANLMHQTFSMAALLEEAVDCHELSASERGLRLTLQPPKSKGIVEADRGRINQVLDNLIGNAMKFSPDGGTIELRMIERREDVLAVVADEGIGVPEDKVDRIFDRFYQIDGSARRRFGGAGIGLAIVKRIIDAHQGDIWVKSAGDKGSRFYFTIPKKPRTDAQRK